VNNKIEAMNAEPPVPHAQALLRLIAGYQATFLIQAAAELKLPDQLASGPRDVATLAAATDTKPDPLRRLLFALAQLGLVVRLQDGRFGLTSLGACLKSDHPDGLNAFARYQAHAIIQLPWANLVHTLRTGNTAFESVFGVPLFDYYAAHPDAAALFAAGMAARTAEHVAAIVGAYDWTAFGTIVDVGGGDGALLTAILAAAPNARGILFEWPSLQAAAAQRIAAAGLADRCTFVGGDFFHSVPPGGDLYLLKHVLHDWEDHKVEAILHNLRRAAPARLLVAEPILPEGDEPALEAAMMDVAMLLVTGGRERTATEFAELYRRAGFRLTRVLPTGSAFRLVEGVAT